MLAWVLTHNHRRLRNILVPIPIQPRLVTTGHEPLTRRQKTIGCAACRTMRAAARRRQIPFGEFPQLPVGLVRAGEKAATRALPFT